MKKKLKHIKLFVFDWDGVFNDGYKIDGKSSNFSAVDSMGINMLRFSYWLKYGEMLKVAVMSGSNNLLAKEYGEQQKFEKVLINCRNKTKGLKTLCHELDVTPDEIAFVFDDILDLKMAELVRLRFMVNNPALKKLRDYAIRHNLYDYYTEHTGAHNAIREVCDHVISLNGNFDEVVKNRLEFSDTYKEYWNIRNNVLTLH